MKNTEIFIHRSRWLCTALLCGGYYMLGHALNPDELITRSRNSQASYEYMFGQYPELEAVGGQPRRQGRCATSDKE